MTFFDGTTALGTATVASGKATLQLPKLAAGRHFLRAVFTATGADSGSSSAVIHYTTSQAAALATKGIRVNCVAPGSVEFPGGTWEKRRTENPALYNRVFASIPFGLGLRTAVCMHGVLAHEAVPSC